MHRSTRARYRARMRSGRSPVSESWFWEASDTMGSAPCPGLRGWRGGMSQTGDEEYESFEPDDAVDDRPGLDEDIDDDAAPGAQDVELDDADDDDLDDDEDDDDE